MRNFDKRLTKLEDLSPHNHRVVVMRQEKPGEAVEVTQARHFAEHPEDRRAGGMQVILQRF